MVGCSNNKVNNNNDIQEEINIEQQEIVETKNELSAEDIKNQLCNQEWIVASAHDNNTQDDFMKYWGTGLRYANSILFNDDNKFSYYVGIGSSEKEYEDRTTGTYEINLEEQSIRYLHNAGFEVYGSYEVEDGKITNITYTEKREYSDDGDIFVTFKVRTEENVNE